MEYICGGEDGVKSYGRKVFNMRPKVVKLMEIPKCNNIANILGVECRMPNTYLEIAIQIYKEARNYLC